MDSFGQTLRRHRQAAGLGLRPFAERVRYDWSHVARVERGQGRGSEDLARRCDDALNAGGALVEAYRREQADGADMRRRAVLGAMGALAAAPAVDRLTGWEALRHGLAFAVDPGADEWERVVADYGHAYYRQPHEQVMGQLARDVTVLQHQLAADSGERRPLLLRAAGQLSVIVALGLVASGQALAARRWWQTAQQVADESGDAETRLLTRAWDVVNGCYDGRPADGVVALSDQVLPLLDAAPVSAASCGLLAGRAQALSLAGRHAEAVETVRALADHVDRLPDAVTGDVESLWGWPEHRLRHTESWVYTHAGHLRAADVAQQRALELYPVSQQRLRTQVQLHRAAAYIRAGHVPDGLRMAADLLDGLPAEQHNELVRTVARHAVAAVPEGERRRAVYGELVERVRV